MTYPFQTGSPSSDPVPSEINRKESNAMIYGPVDCMTVLDNLHWIDASTPHLFKIDTPLPAAKWRPATPEEVATYPCDQDTFYRDLLCKVSEENSQLRERIADLEF